MKLPALVDLTCLQVTELVGDYMASSVLSVRDRARFEQHLYACTWCMDYLQQMEQTVRAAGRLAASDSTAPVAAAPESQLLALYRRALAGPSTAQTAATVKSRPKRAPLPSRAASRAPQGARFAFKFLDREAVGALSGFAWPRPSGALPGAWVDVAAPLEPGRVGIHACGLGDLSTWLHASLWLIEFEGPVRRAVGGMVGARGRLVTEVRGWREGGATRFAQAAFDHASELAAAGSTEQLQAAQPCLASAAYHVQNASIALAAFCAAMAMARMRGITHFVQSGYDLERRWQSGWIARELQLDTIASAKA